MHFGLNTWRIGSNYSNQRLTLLELIKPKKTMPIHHRARYKILSNVLQATFGKSSAAKPPTHFMSMKMVNDNHILVNYSTTVSYGHQSMYYEMRNKYRDEAYQIIKNRLKKVVEAYSEEIEKMDKLLEPKKEPYQEPAQKKIELKFLEHTIQESIEAVSKNVYSASSYKAFFRIQCLVEVK